MSDPATPLPAPHLSPKEQFLTREDDAQKWRQVSRSALTLNVLTFSFSEWAINNNPSAEQIKAVRDFIEVTLNLAEPRKGERTPFPDKRLTTPSETPSGKKEEKK